MPQTLLIIGDVHGCYFTFRALVETYWQPDSMRLIQLGDLTDRGRFVPDTIEFARQLEEKHPEQVTFLKGNHEAMLLELWGIIQSANPTLAAIYTHENSSLMQYKQRNTPLKQLEDTMIWLQKRPLFWENDHIFVSHAGISAAWNNIQEALNENHPESILWTRSLLKNIGKLQIIGHTPILSGQPMFRSEECCWNIDTGAVFGQKLTAMHLALDGTLVEMFSLPTLQLDYK